MKLLSLIEDANGQIHLSFATSPEIVRRDHAKRAGSAHIIYCAISASEIGKKEVEQTFHNCFKNHHHGDGYDISRREAVLAAMWLAQVKPLILRVRNKLRRKLVKPVIECFSDKIHQVATLKQRVLTLK